MRCSLPQLAPCILLAHPPDPFIRAWPSYFRSAEYYSDLAQVARVGGKNGSRVRTEYDAITPWFWVSEGVREGGEWGQLRQQSVTVTAPGCQSAPDQQ
jgi:hypothetical protein